MTAPRRVILAGYGNTPSEYGSQAGTFFRTGLARAACLYAAGERGRPQTDVAAWYVLSGWQGVLPAHWTHPPTEGPPVVRRPARERDQWGCAVARWMLKDLPGEPLLLEVHDWAPVVRLVERWAPRSWEVRSPDFGSTRRQREAWYLPRLRELPPLDVYGPLPSFSPARRREST